MVIPRAEIDLSEIDSLAYLLLERTIHFQAQVITNSSHSVCTDFSALPVGIPQIGLVH